MATKKPDWTQGYEQATPLDTWRCAVVVRPPGSNTSSQISFAHPSDVDEAVLLSELAIAGVYAVKHAKENIVAVDPMKEITIIDTTREFEDD